jgi:glycine cleavage system regulatory protein
MSISLVATFSGPDRAGLVETLSRTFFEHGANWDASRMARLANQFAGILLASVPESRLDDLKAALDRLTDEGLHVSVSIAASAAPSEERNVRLEMVGQDRPGVVHEFAEALAELGVSITELDARTYSASWTGETLFRAAVELSVPRDQPLDELQSALEQLANEMMVELKLSDAPVE